MKITRRATIPVNAHSPLTTEEGTYYHFYHNGSENLIAALTSKATFRFGSETITLFPGIWELEENE